MGKTGYSKDELNARYYQGFADGAKAIEAKYRDLEDDGLLLRLPCKIGDVVYAVTRDFISEYTICSIEAYNEGFFFRWRCEKGIYINVRGFTNYQIGQDVFLTQAEAEQKLKEMESEQDGNTSKNTEIIR